MPPRIDAPGGPLYPSRFAVPGYGHFVLALAFLGLAGCATNPSPATPDTPTAATAPTKPAADGAVPGDTASAADIALAAVSATAPRAPLQLVFGWSLHDRDARFGGKAVARVEPPYRARLDLFGPREEGYLSAAVVGEEMRLPPSAESQSAIVPPPALLWSALGVLNPPADARLTGVRRQGQETRLEYARGSERWRFTLVGGKLHRAELDRAGGRQTVELKGTGPFGLPKEAVYRDYAAFRELTLTLDRANEVESFPPGTWSPGGSSPR